eukprot:TRINITY_DN25751_c0_g1_i1.p1 TRINITY_DN25751_c0_g1~~TRINITY_DN25751_c0_g1_i1.p1  ORF type:complete len:719 (+),score=32.40 TRINITY_DN25751_c0_g1_i1:82-2238(+)
MGKSAKSRASKKRDVNALHNVEKVRGFYIIADDYAARPHKRQGLESGSPLMRWRHRESAADADVRHGLAEVIKKRGWTVPLGGVQDRLDRLSQALLSGERSQPLKRRFLLLASVLLGLYALILRSTLRQQAQSWLAHPGSTIGLTGIDGSFVVPLLFTFWYVLMCAGLIRLMESMPPAESFIFELTVIYNVLQAGMNAYVAIMMMREARSLGLKFVGNAVSAGSAEGRHLGIIAILHYHLKILELCDTFFLILRKKLYRDSLHLHLLMKIQAVWSWHIACRFGCGGDIYFPIVANALCSTFLHVHYAFAVMQPHVAPPRWLQFSKLFLNIDSMTSLRRSTVQLVQLLCFQLCIIYGVVSLYIGEYPRLVLAISLIQCCFGMLIHSDFHYRSSKHALQPEGVDAHKGALAFSFDSSGWCYFYHFGVAMWIQEHFTEEIAHGELAFSGSSGGALVGCALAVNIDIPMVLDSIIHGTWTRCRRNPTLLPFEVRQTLERFCPADAYLLATNRLRVLMTRVLSIPPFFMGEVATRFRNNEHLFDVLGASSCIPGLFGWGKLMDGGRYIDGMFWMSSLVPWRSFKSQNVCRVSCFSAFGADIGPRWSAIPPFWWPVFPPSQQALEGLFWAGYRDIAAAFGSPDGRPSGCGLCMRRQAGSTPAKQPRLTASAQTIDELISVYEWTARRDWTVFLGFLFVVTAFLTSIWLSGLFPWHAVVESATVL